jgi:hypothetical protein
MRLAQWGVTCKIESSCFYLALVHFDSVVLLSPPLRPAQKRYHQCYKDRRHSKTMTENGLVIQTISTKRTDFQTDGVLAFGQVTEKNEKTLPSYFLKFLLASRTNGTFGFARHTSQSIAKPKEFFCQRTGKEIVFCTSCK